MQQRGEVGVRVMSGELGLLMSHIYESKHMSSGCCWKFNIQYAMAHFFPSGGYHDICAAVRLTSFGSLLQQLTKQKLNINMSIYTYIKYTEEL